MHFEIGEKAIIQNAGDRNGMECIILADPPPVYQMYGYAYEVCCADGSAWLVMPRHLRRKSASGENGIMAMFSAPAIRDTVASAK